MLMPAIHYCGANIHIIFENTKVKMLKNVTCLWSSLSCREFLLGSQYFHFYQGALGKLFYRHCRAGRE